jgi:hypothetical protein
MYPLDDGLNGMELIDEETSAVLQSKVKKAQVRSLA